MARNKIEQVQCDRCKRVELQAIPPEPKTVPDFKGTFEGKDLVYNDLCSFCKSAVGRLWLLLSEWQRELTQKLGPTIQNDQAPPTSSAPDYSPPKPHSAAAATKKP